MALAIIEYTCRVCESKLQWRAAGSQGIPRGSDLSCKLEGYVRKIIPKKIMFAELLPVRFMNPKKNKVVILLYCSLESNLKLH